MFPCWNLFWIFLIWRYIFDVIVSNSTVFNQVFKLIIYCLGIFIYVIFILGLEFVCFWEDLPIRKNLNELFMLSENLLEFVFILGLEFFYFWNDFNSWFKVTMKNSLIQKDLNGLLMLPENLIYLSGIRLKME